MDTGASITAVERDVLDRLGIRPHRVTPVVTANGPSRQPVYSCVISFPGTPIPTLPFNSVVGSQIRSLGYSALIGRDVLRHFQLVYNGKEGFWTLAF
ncbi:MAG: aspartyl protease family protein [Nitrospinota bacterium]